MNTSWIRWTSVPAIVLFLGTQTGCESKISKESFDQIKVGMTMEQVEKLLGGSGTEDSAPPGLTISGAGAPSTTNTPKDKTFVWKGEGTTIVVVFQDGKVVQKTMK